MFHHQSCSTPPALPPESRFAVQVTAKQQKEEDDGDRRRIVEARLVERQLVDVGDEDFGGATGAAIGHDIDEVETRHRIEHADHEAEEQRWPQQRKGNAQETAERIGAVDRRGLIEIGGNVLQAGEDDDHVESEHLPDVRGDHQGSAQVKELRNGIG